MRVSCSSPVQDHELNVALLFGVFFMAVFGTKANTIKLQLKIMNNLVAEGAEGNFIEKINVASIVSRCSSAANLRCTQMTNRHFVTFSSKFCRNIQNENYLDFLKDVSWLDELVLVSSVTRLFPDQHDKGDLT
jgi:hypothetical protein